jgi:aminocarboxymuconate-semialdehyde decarboxylase
MAAAHPDYGPVLVEDGGHRYLKYPGRDRLGPLPPSIFEPDRRLADMEAGRVDRQIIAIPPPNFHYHVPPEVGAEFASIQNDELMALSDTNPDRFHVFGTLPLQDPAASLAEIERIAPFPRMRGVQIGSNVAGIELDDPVLETIWSDLESRNLPVWVHPDQRAIAGADRLNRFYLQNLIGLPLESTIAMANLIFGGVLSRHPELRFGWVHGGGFAPYQIGRWDHGHSVRPEPKEFIGQVRPRDYFDRFFFDTLTHDPASLQLLGERTGWKRLLLGSDYPFDMAAPDPVGAVEAIGLPPEVLDDVLGGNAAAFLRPLP